MPMRATSPETMGIKEIAKLYLSTIPRIVDLVSLIDFPGKLTENPLKRIVIQVVLH